MHLEDLVKALNAESLLLLKSLNVWSVAIDEKERDCDHFDERMLFVCTQINFLLEEASAQVCNVSKQLLIALDLQTCC